MGDPTGPLVPATEVQLIPRLAMRDYLADPCRGPSLTGSIAHVLVSRSPLHGWMKHPRLNPDYAEDRDSVTDLGEAAHRVLLEDSWDGIVFVEAEDWRTKEARSQRDGARANGEIPLLAGRRAELELMVATACDFIDGSELASGWEGSAREATILWSEGGVQCRARPDVLAPGLVVNYKTTRNANPEAFIRGPLMGLGYDLRGAFQLRAARALGAAEQPRYVWLVQETDSPAYACSLVGMSPAMLHFADQKVDRALELWRECLAGGRARQFWPAYPRRIHWAEPPAWDVSRWQERVDADAEIMRALRGGGA